MQPILIIVLATAASVPLGLWLRRDLATLSYRNADEVDLPEPGPRWWVVWTSVIVFGSLAGAAALSHSPLTYLALVPLAASGPWLAAVDFDVHRIPNRMLLPASAATLLAVVGVGAAMQDWRTLVVALAAATVAGAVLATVHYAAKGGVGFGDVKLAGAIALAIGPLGVSSVWLSILAGSAAALIYAKVRSTIGLIPYGPWLLSGGWLASLSTAFTS